MEMNKFKFNEVNIKIIYKKSEEITILFWYCIVSAHHNQSEDSIQLKMGGIISMAIFLFHSFFLFIFFLFVVIDLFLYLIFFSFIYYILFMLIMWTFFCLLFHHHDHFIECLFFRCTNWVLMNWSVQSEMHICLYHFR